MKQWTTDIQQSASSDNRQKKTILGRYFLDVTFDIPEERKQLYQAILQLFIKLHLLEILLDNVVQQWNLNFLFPLTSNRL